MLKLYRWGNSDTAQMTPESCTFPIWNEHVSIGTTQVLHTQHDPETLASRLELLHGHFFGMKIDKPPLYIDKAVF